MAVSVYSTAQDGTGGEWLDRLGQVTNWKHTITLPGGDASASFNFAADPQFTDPSLLAGRLIYAKAGAALVFAGRLEQPSRDQPWEMTVIGRAALAKDHVVTTSGSTLNTVLAAAIATGLPWTIPSGLTLTNPKTPIAQFGNVDDGLGLLATDSVFWSLDVNGIPSTFAALPATPTLRLDVVDMPDRTLQNYHNAAVVEFNNSGAGGASMVTTVTASAAEIALRGRIETFLDLTGYSSITLAQAQAAGAALLADDAVLTWADAFAAPYGALQTFSGVLLDPAVVRPTVMRVFAQHPDDIGAQALDVPIGQVDYDDATQTVSLTPLASATTRLQGVLAKLVAADGS